MSRSRVARFGRVLVTLLASAAILFAARTALATPHYYSYLPQYSATGAQIVGGGINNSDTVAFQTTVGGVTTVYSAYGGHLTKIVDTTQTAPVTFRYVDGGFTMPGTALYNNIRSVGIDDSGNGYFVASLQPQNLPANYFSYPADRVVTGSGGSLASIYDFQLSGYQATATYSDSGIVAATYATLGVTTVVSHGVATTIASQGNIYPSFPPVINDTGMLAGILGVSGITVTNGSTWSLGYSAYPGYVDDVALNNRGSIFFVSEGNGNPPSLQVLDGGNALTLFGFDNRFRYFGSLLLNDSNSIAFTGFHDLVKGIYIGPNPDTDKVVAVGDSFDGSTITDLSLFKKGLNNSGDIAFVATLADGRSGVYIAEPVPEPSSVVLAALAALGCLGLRLRNRLLGERR